MLRYRDRTCDPFAEAERLTVADAFRIHAGIDLLATLSPTARATATCLATRARRAGFAIADEDNWADIFCKMLAARVEPQTGAGPADPSLSNIPAAKRRWRGPSRTIRAWPSGSSFMPAAWNWPTALAN